MRKPRRPAQELRHSIEFLPLDTKRAMLEGIEANSIIVGAYTNSTGGVCPMLAAHRNGGRTSYASFAKAWDRYTGAGNRPRPATERELRTLRVMLEASIAIEEGRADLSEIAAEIRSIKARRPRRARMVAPAERPLTGERDRTSELRERAGWAWTRPFRCFDAYEAAVYEAELQQRERGDESRDRDGSRELELV